MAPPDSEFSRPHNGPSRSQTISSAGVSNVFLEVQYTGDVARISSHGRLLDDDFYNGKTWSIGLRRFAEPIRQGPLDLSILPLRKDAPIYLEDRDRPDFDAQSQMDKLGTLKLVPEYQFVIPIGAP